MGLRLLAFPRLLPLLSPSQRLWAPFRCGSRVRLLAAPRAVVPGGGGDAAVPASGWGGLQPALHPFPTAAPPVPPLHPLSSPPSPRGSTHRIPTAPRAFVARWGPRAATPPPPSSPRSPRSAEAGMHAGTCVAWLSATGPPPLPSGAATANAGSVRDPLPGAAGTGAAPPPPPSPRISSCNAEELPNSSVPPLRPIGAAMGSEGWGGWQWGQRGGGKAAGSCWGILRDPSLLRGCPRCPTLLPPPHGRGGLGPMAPLSIPEGGLGGGWSPLRRSAAASKWLRAAEPRGWGGRGAAFC